MCRYALLNILKIRPSIQHVIDYFPVDSFTVDIIFSLRKKFLDLVLSLPTPYGQILRKLFVAPCQWKLPAEAVDVEVESKVEQLEVVGHSAKHLAEDLDLTDSYCSCKVT